MTLLQYLNSRDRFAAANGIQLTEIREDFARAEMTVEERHLNGGHVVQGGCLFTLADLAVAAVMNTQGILTLGISNNISFLQSAREGDHLVAEATLTLNHIRLPFCEVRITNQRGDLLCLVTGTGYRKRDLFEFDALM